MLVKLSIQQTQSTLSPEVQLAVVHPQTQSQDQDQGQVPVTLVAIQVLQR